MSAINPATTSLLQSQMANVQLRQAVDVKVARKAMDAAEAQGAAAVKLLDAAAEIARQSAGAQGQGPTLGAVASGLGMRLDVYA